MTYSYMIKLNLQRIKCFPTRPHPYIQDMAQIQLNLIMNLLVSLQQRFIARTKIVIGVAVCYNIQTLSCNTHFPLL